MKIISKNAAVYLTGAVCSLFLMTASAESLDAYNLHNGFYLTGNTMPIFAGGVDAGYLFTPRLGVEVGYDSIWDWYLLGTVDVSMYHLDVKTIMPFGSRGELFGKFGVGIINGTEKNTLLSNYNQTSQSWGASVGFGIGYDVMPSWVITLEANGMIYPESHTLNGGLALIPSIGLTHYFDA